MTTQQTRITLDEFPHLAPIDLDGFATSADIAKAVTNTLAPRYGLYPDDLSVQFEDDGVTATVSEALGFLTLTTVTISRPTTPTVQDWYFTFGAGQQHDGKYVVIAGDPFTARDEMVRHFGTRWCDQYPTADAAGVKEFGLVELPRDQWAAAAVPSAEKNCLLCKTTAAAPGTCCSSHEKELCHLCYRRTHFVEVCVAGCKDCAAEDLPVNLRDRAVTR